MEDKTQNSPNDHYAEKEINLLDFIIVLLKHKCFILIFCLAAMLILTIYSAVLIINSKKDTIYTSECIIVPNNTRLEVLQKVLNSSKLAYRIVNNNNVLPLLYPELWNEKEGKWIEDKAPTFRDTFKLLMSNLVIKANTENNALWLTVTYKNPKVPQKILLLYIEQLEKYLKQESIQRRQKTEERIKMLPSQFKYTYDPILLKQIATAIVQDYMENGYPGFDVIEPPSAPEQMQTKKPIPFKLIAFVMILSLISAILLSFLDEYLSKIKEREPERLGQIKKLLRIG